MNKYVKPELEMIKFSVEEEITTGVGGDMGTEDPVSGEVGSDFDED